MTWTSINKRHDFLANDNFPGGASDGGHVFKRPKVFSNLSLAHQAFFPAGRAGVRNSTFEVSKQFGARPALTIARLVGTTPTIPCRIKQYFYLIFVLRGPAINGRE